MRTAKAKKMLPKNHHLPKKISQKGRALIAKVNRASSHFTQDIDHYVTQKPYSTMGMIMLTGVCIGFLIHRH